MSFDAPFDRRTFLALTGSAAVAGAVPPLSPAAAETIAAPATLMIVSEQAGDLSPLATASGARLIVLRRDDDPVRFWRREVEPAAVPGAVLTGVTLWSDYILLRGLAAEARLKLAAESALEGAPSLIAWRIA